MARYRDRLPQLEGGLFLTDGGLETSLLFHHDVEVPSFATFPLLDEARTAGLIRDYYVSYISLARRLGVGFVLESPTWRANPDWGDRLGYPGEALDAANRRAVAFLQDLRDAYETPGAPMVISATVGPRGDGYAATVAMGPDAAEAYHARQIGIFAEAGADMVAAFTLTNPAEATGIARACARAGLPSVISFTVETDGRLPNGDSLEEAIGQVDEATGAAPAYYMINCSHLTHFADRLDEGGAWVRRIRGVRGNASKLSHAELDEATSLDDGDPEEFGRENRDLRRRHPHLCVLGGCCGTDLRHVEAVGFACTAAEA